METPVEEIYEMILGSVGEDLQVCGYFSENESELLYCDEATQERYTDEEIEDVLETALLDTIADPMYESLHDEELRTTIRVFESKIDILVGLDEYEGLIFALDPNPDCEVQQLATEITTVIES